MKKTLFLTLALIISFLSFGQPTNPELVFLRLNISAPGNTYDTDIYFNDNASTSFDFGFDAQFFFGNVPSFAVYSLLVEGNVGDPYTLQALNTLDLLDVTIPLGVNANQGQQLTFSINVNQLPDTTEIYLEDNEAGTSTLLNDTDYVFTPATALSGDGRFFLRITDDNLITTFTYNNAWSPSDPNGIATGFDDIVVESGDAVINADTNCNSVTVNPGAGLTVDAAITLAASGGVLLQSSSTNYSSLINNGTVSGPVTYERHVNINAGAGTTTGANDLIAAPLTGQSFDQFAAANPNIYANPSDPTQVLFGPFSKTLGTFQIYTTDETATLDPGVGYRAASNDNSAFTFTGSIQNGIITNDIQNSGPNNEEWNLIGNPYPSYLSALDFLSEDVGGGEINITLFDPPTAAVWGYDGSFESWTIYNLATATPSTLIAPGQGFFVSADVTKTAGFDVEFTPDMRRTGSGDDFIPGRNAELIFLKLRLSAGTNTSRTDFYFNPNASLGFDVGYDAAHWGDALPDFALYSILVQDELAGDEIVLQALNSSDLSNVTIPLGMKASQGEQVTFSIAESTIPESVNVYLDDTLSNTSTLLNDSDYVITLNSDQNGIGRFFLRYEEDALSTIENNLDNIKIVSLKDTDELIVNGQLFENTTLDLYDIQGRKVLSTKLDESLIQNRINVANFNTGVYIVTIKNKTQELTHKVVIE